MTVSNRNCRHAVESRLSAADAHYDSFHLFEISKCRVLSTEANVSVGEFSSNAVMTAPVPGNQATTRFVDGSDGKRSGSSLRGTTSAF